MGEFAVLVHDDYQGKGLGYKLVDLMIELHMKRDWQRSTVLCYPTINVC